MLIVPVQCGAMTVIGVSTLPQVRLMMTVLDKIKAFFKRLKPEAKGAEKKAGEAPETKVAEASEKEGDETSSK